MIPVAEALKRVLAGVPRMAAEDVPLADALGRVLAEDVASRLSHPPTAVSAMDGYAVRAADVAGAPVTLRQIGESAAGRRFSGRLRAGETVRIFTGAPLPEGADAVVMQEDCEAEGNSITLREATEPGRFVRAAGLDFRRGDVLLGAGTVLSARDIGLAAAMNVAVLPVARKPLIAFLSTGNELVMPGAPVGPDQIVNSNTVALQALLRCMGGEPLNLGIAGDDEGSLKERLAAAEGADLLVTMGGASVGDHDLVRKVLDDEGLKLGFYKVAMRPGKPMIFGHLGSMPVLGLPGNPVSVGVASVVFLKPAMEAMLGVRRDAARPEPTARLGRDLGANGPRQQYLRATLAPGDNGEPVATPFAAQDSAMTANLARADCLIVRPPGAPAARAGERVPIVALRFALVSA